LKQDFHFPNKFGFRLWLLKQDNIMIDSFAERMNYVINGFIFLQKHTKNAGLF